MESLAGLCPASPPADCDTLLWIGDSDHFQMQDAWRVCCRHCDSISYRGNLHEATESPPRRMPTHVIVAQTNRHDGRNSAIDGAGVSRLRECFPNANLLVIRSPLVAPTVRLPQTNQVTAQSEGPSVWIDSISCHDAIGYLPHWLLTSQNQRRVAEDQIDAPTRDAFPAVIVASRHSIAEPLIDSLSSLCTGAGGELPLVQWQRELTPRSARGFASVVWDESAAAPTTAENWHARCRRAVVARHVWISGMANWQQRQVACENGVHFVLDKPCRVESLLRSLAVLPSAI